MKGELKDKVARGVAWSMAEKIGTMLLQMAVSLIILRLLTRDILGVMAIPTAVVAVALVLVDSGFSQALIRKAAPFGGRLQIGFRLQYRGFAGDVRAFHGAGVSGVAVL